jgi:hypothetical protein
VRHHRRCPFLTLLCPSPIPVCLGAEHSFVIWTAPNVDAFAFVRGQRLPLIIVDRRPIFSRPALLFDLLGPVLFPSRPPMDTERTTITLQSHFCFLGQPFLPATASTNQDGPTRMFKCNAHLMQSYPIQTDIEIDTGTWLWPVGLTHFGVAPSLLLTQLLSNPKDKNKNKAIIMAHHRRKYLFCCCVRCDAS